MNSMLKVFFIWVGLFLTLYIPTSLTLLNWNMAEWDVNTRAAVVWITFICSPALALCIFKLIEYSN